MDIKIKNKPMFKGLSAIVDSFLRFLGLISGIVGVFKYLFGGELLFSIYLIVLGIFCYIIGEAKIKTLIVEIPHGQPKEKKK